MIEIIIKVIVLIYFLKIYLLFGIWINIVENIMLDFLIVYICDVSELNVYEFMLNE